MSIPQAAVEQKNPFRSPGFGWLWCGQLVSLIGSHLFPMAIVAIALEQEDALAATGIVMGARFAGLALFIIVGGVLADRFDKIRLMITSDIVRFGVVIALLLVGSGSPLWALASVTFIMGVGEALFQPAYNAITPAVVPKESLKRANAFLNTLKNIGHLAGPGIAGFLVALIGIEQALLIDASTFIISIVTLVCMAKVMKPSEKAPIAKRKSMVREAAAGVGIMIKMPWLGVLEILAVVQVLLAVGPWFVLLPIIADHQLGGTTAYGLLLSAFGIGGVGGAALAGILDKFIKRPGIWGLVGLSLFGAGCMAFQFTSSVWALGALFAVAGVGTQFFDVLKKSAVQEHVPEKFLGRVFSLDAFASLVTLPIGQLAAGLFIASPDQAISFLAIAGVFVFATTLLPLLVPGVARFGSEPHTDDAVELDETLSVSVSGQEGPS